MIKMQFSKQPYRISPRRIVGFVVAIAILAILLSSVLELYQKHKAIRAHIENLKEDKGILEEKYTTIHDLNTRIETQEGKEYILRDKYRLVRPGEGLIVVTTAEQKEQSAEKQPVLKLFWNTLLKGLGLGS